MEGNSSRNDDCRGMDIVLEIQIIKGKAKAFLGMVTILGMVAALVMAVLRMVNVLVMLRAAIWTLLFKELYLTLISKIWNRQTNRHTDKLTLPNIELLCN